MNVAYYILIFDQHGSEVLLTNFNMGEETAKTTQKSTMVVESNIAYKQEVKEGDEVDINLTYCDHDKKRILYPNLFDQNFFKQKNIILEFFL